MKMLMFFVCHRIRADVDPGAHLPHARNWFFFIKVRTDKQMGRLQGQIAEMRSRPKMFESIFLHKLVEGNPSKGALPFDLNELHWPGLSGRKWWLMADSKEKRYG